MCRNCIDSSPARIFRKSVEKYLSLENTAIVDFIKVIYASPLPRVVLAVEATGKEEHGGGFTSGQQQTLKDALDMRHGGRISQIRIRDY
jgi:hypothetical protein